jgi:hypothetical protein
MGRTVVKQDDSARTGNRLYELNTLWIILRLDLRVVVERGVLRRVRAVLEAVCVERDGGLFAAQVLDLEIVRYGIPVALTLAGRRVRWTSP